MLPRGHSRPTVENEHPAFLSAARGNWVLSPSGQLIGAQIDHWSPNRSNWSPTIDHMRDDVKLTLRVLFVSRLPSPLCFTHVLLCVYTLRLHSVTFTCQCRVCPPARPGVYQVGVYLYSCVQAPHSGHDSQGLRHMSVFLWCRILENRSLHAD